MLYCRQLANISFRSASNSAELTLRSELRLEMRTVLLGMHLDYRRATALRVAMRPTAHTPWEGCAVAVPDIVA